MSDQTLRKIWICTDVWMDILHFFDRFELGLKLAPISDRFDVLMDAHFDAKSELTVWRDVEIRKDKNAEKPILRVYLCEEGGFLKLALPDRPLPNKLRFLELYIMYIDHSVIAFLRANPHIFGNSTDLGVEILPSAPAEGTDVAPILDVFTRQIWPIFVPNIRFLRASARADHLDNFFRLISPTVLSAAAADPARLISIEYSAIFPDLLGDDDGPTTTSSAGCQALSEWLHKPTIDGRPKQLRCFYKHGSRTNEWINSFKEAFLRATTITTNSSVISYCISFRIQNPTPIEPFELVNEWTQEKLTLRKERREHRLADYEWVLKRCPIIVGGTAPAAVQWVDDNLYANVDILLSGDNDCIGPLCPPTGQTSNSAEEN